VSRSSRPRVLAVSEQLVATLDVVVGTGMSVVLDLFVQAVRASGGRGRPGSR
jgi:hypothetical protein